MRQPSRATRYRQAARKRLGVRSKRLGRKRLGRAMADRDMFLMVEAVFATRRGRPPGGAYDLLTDSGLPMALLAVAAWYVCAPVERRRRADKPNVETAAKVLVGRYDGRMSLTDAKNLVSRGMEKNEPWVAELLGADRQASEWEPRAAACPSKRLGMSRRMVSYWHNHRLYGEAVRVIERVRRLRA